MATKKKKRKADKPIDRPADAGDQDSPAQFGNYRRAQGEGAGRMDDDKLQNNVAAMLTDCVQFSQGELEPHRADATLFYLGKPFGNEEDGRSQVVMTEVRDGVQAVLPQMLRVFFSGERAVEFIPRNEAGVDAAEQAIDYCNFVFDQDNGGKLKCHSVMKDGLIRKIGVVKWWWDDSSARQAYKLENVTEYQLELLGQDDDIDITRVTQTGSYVGTPPNATKSPSDSDADAPDENTDPPQGTPEGVPTQPLYTVELTKTDKDGRFRFEALPPEEFVFSREGRSLDDAVCVAHRTNKRRGDLIAMGIDEKVIERVQAADDIMLRESQEEIARREVLDTHESRDVPTGPENDEMLYCEAYVKIDFDGDGIAELRCVRTLGLGYEVIDQEPVDERPFALFCPDPEPHTILGQSWADRLMDMQRIKSALMRGTLDSLAAALYPRNAFQLGQVNIADILNTEIGAPIRTNAPPASVIMPMTTPFTGKEALPVLEKMDEIIERRTGQSMGANALDMDALQSTEKQAAQQAISAAQLQVDLLVWIFAEMFLKRLFKGMLRALCKHQPRKRMMRLRGKWVEVDPRAWDSDMDVLVNVGLGSGMTEQRIATLTAVAADQTQIIQTLGPTNPICTLAMLRNTKAKLLELRGFKDVSQFYSPVDPNWKPAPAPPPPPTHEQVLAQAETQNELVRTQRELAIKEAELELKRQQAASDRDLKIRQMADDFTLRRLQIEAQFKTSFSEQQLEAAATAQENWLSRVRAGHEMALAQNQQAHDQDIDAHNQALAADQQGHDQDMDQQAQALAAQQAPEQPSGGTQ